MGRLTELFDFINRENVPSEHEMKVIYSYINKTKEIMDVRKKYRKGLKEQGKQNDLLTILK